jgi:hypothetical protein
MNLNIIQLKGVTPHNTPKLSKQGGLKYLNIKTYRINGGALFDKSRLFIIITEILKSSELLETPKD